MPAFIRAVRARSSRLQPQRQRRYFENVLTRARLHCCGATATEGHMSDHDSLGALYFDEARRSFRGYKRLADQALEQADDQQIFFTPHADSNSLAQLVKHIAGNMRSR